MEGGNAATNGSDYNTSRAGAKPHGQKDKVLLPKKLISALPTSNQEPTLSARIGSGASPRTFCQTTKCSKLAYLAK